MVTQQQIQVTQGSLFLIDHIGPCPTGIDFRHFTQKAIEDHLKRHTYYYQRSGKPGRANRMRVTPKWLCMNMKNVFAKANVSFYLPRAPEDDNADALLRKGSTEGFPDKVLDRYAYNRVTFTESDLPAYAEHTSEEMEPSTDNQDTDDLAADQSSDRASCNMTERSASGSNHRSIVDMSQARAVSCSHSPSRDTDATYRSAKDNVDELGSSEVDEDDDDNDDLSYDEGKGQQANVRRKRGLDNTTSTANVKAEHAGRKGSELGNASMKTKSPEKCETDCFKKQATPTFVSQTPLPGTSSPRQVTDSLRKAPNPNVRGPQDSGTMDLRISLTQPPPSSTQRPRTSIQRPIPSPISAQRPSINWAKLPNDNDHVIDRNVPLFFNYERLKPELSKREPLQLGAYVGYGKRKRDDLDDGMEHESSKEGIAVETPKRQAIEAAVRGVAGAAQAIVVLPGATNSPELPSKPIPATAVRPVSGGKSLPKNLYDHEVKDSQSPQHGVSSQETERPQQQPTINTDDLGQSFEQLYNILQVATDQVIASVGDIGGSLSLLDPSPSDRLKILYTRCWGSEWEAVRLRLTKEYLFTVPEVTMALISAFIFEHVLSQKASIQDIKDMELELKGIMGRAILRTLDLENNEHRIAEVARNIDSEDARATLAQSDEQLEQELHAKAEKLTKNFWNVVVPHFRGLSRLAHGHGLSSKRPESAWLDVFEPAVTELMEAVLRHRLKLLATGCEHSYTWPEVDEKYGLQDMHIHGAKLDLPLRVLFTISPGLKVMRLGATDLKTFPGMKAKVKVQKMGKA